MAIKSNFEYKGTKYDSVIFKIVRVFGSKAEGWNAVFAFVVEGDEFTELRFRGMITVGLPWKDANPFPLLYKRMEEILTDGGFVIVEETKKSFIETAWVDDLIQVEETPPEVVAPPKPKKTRKKKTDGVSKPS